MITDKGKQILSKYILGINPTFATHIAVGCGADSYPDDAIELDENGFRENLVFESFRAPIISRGVLKENDAEKIVFEAEIPSDSRYGITEIGLYSEQRNVRASQFDSKPISQFNAPLELWYKINGSNSVGAFDIVNSLDPTNSGYISPSANDTALNACYAYSNDNLWTTSQARQIQKQCPRNGNGVIMIRGNYANLTYNTSTSAWTQTTNYGLETSTIGLNMSKNSPDDEIRLAFTLASTNGGSPASITGQGVRINIWFEFVNNFSNSNKLYAKAKTSINGDITDITDPTVHPSTRYSRYIVHSFKKSDFVVDNDFSWASINGIRIFASVQKNGSVSGDYWLVFDGIRLENISTQSPTYGLVAYTQLYVDDQLPIVKEENTTNYVEFRLAVEQI